MKDLCPREQSGVLSLEIEGFREESSSDVCCDETVFKALGMDFPFSTVTIEPKGSTKILEWLPLHRR